MDLFWIQERRRVTNIVTGRNIEQCLNRFSPYRAGLLSAAEATLTLTDHTFILHPSGCLCIRYVMLCYVIFLLDSFNIFCFDIVLTSPVGSWMITPTVSQVYYTLFHHDPCYILFLAISLAVTASQRRFFIVSHWVTPVSHHVSFWNHIIFKGK